MQRPRALSPELETLTDAEIQARRGRADRSAPDPEQEYREVLLPLEREAVWRERLADPEAKVPLLFLTVGGQADTPILAGLRWDAARVVLLCTPSSRRHGESTVEALGLRPDQFNLTDIGEGDDPTELYRVLRQEWAQRGQPRGTVIDFTGGFKTMSVAAGLAASLLPGATCAYVATRQERVGRATWWLETTVQRLPNPLQVFGDLDREVARALQKERKWQEAASRWKPLCEALDRRPDHWRRLWCSALAHQQSLRLEESINNLEELERRLKRDLIDDSRLRQDPLGAPWAQAVVRDRLEGARRLSALLAQAKEQGDDDPSLFTDRHYPELLAFLLAQARDRQQRGELDLAVLLAYRTLEGVMQRALGLRGVDAKKPDVAALCVQLGKREDELRDLLGAPPHLPLGYAQLATLLQRVGPDALGRVDWKRLRNIANERNASVFAHGLKTTHPKTLETLLNEAEACLTGLVGAPERAALERRHQAGLDE